MMNKPFLILAPLLVFLVGFWIPEDHVIPVEGAKPHDWNKHAFWFGGKQYTNKGIDIFAKKGTAAKAATKGIVVYQSTNIKGQKSVTVLGSKWRLHHYDHLAKVTTRPLQVVHAGDVIGHIATKRKNNNRTAFLSYSIQSLTPKMTKLDVHKPQGWKKIFYVNPSEFLTTSSH